MKNGLKGRIRENGKEKKQNTFFVIIIHDII